MSWYHIGYDTNCCNIAPEENRFYSKIWKYHDKDKNGKLSLLKMRSSPEHEYFAL